MLQLIYFFEKYGPNQVYIHKNFSLCYLNPEMLWWMGKKGEELPIEEAEIFIQPS